MLIVERVEQTTKAPALFIRQGRRTGPPHFINESRGVFLSPTRSALAPIFYVSALRLALKTQIIRIRLNSRGRSATTTAPPPTSRLRVEVHTDANDTRQGP